MINTIRTYALFVVVFIHTHLYLSSYTVVDNAPIFLHNFYTYFLSYFHPASVLAAVSGYLFFRDYSQETEDKKDFFDQKYFKRMKTIFIPYFFWITLFFFVNNFLLSFSASQNSSLFRNEHTQISMYNYLKSFVYPGLAIAQHLWYLNNLLFLFAATPIILWLNKKKWLYFSAMLLISVYFYYTFSEFKDQSHHIIKYRFVMFYALGALLSLNKEWMFRVLYRPVLLSSISILIFTLAFTLPLISKNPEIIYLINSITVPIIIFFIALFFIKKYIDIDNAEYKRSSHFLLYILHPLLLSFICKIVFQSKLLNINHYWAMLLLTIILSFTVIQMNNLIYFLMKRYFNKLTSKIL